MDFPITELLDHKVSTEWLQRHFHPKGLKCPRCKAPVVAARIFRRTKRSRLNVYRCKRCQKVYTLYTGTVFEKKHWQPTQTVALLRGILQGVSSSQLARELDVTFKTVLDIRHTLQANAEFMQPKSPLHDARTETDEMFQNAGEKRRETQRFRRPATAARQQKARAWHVGE